MLQNHTTTSTPPILPSPARLGLTTTPSSPPHPPPPSTSITTSTPLPLLPLLPPLPRSHSLLLHLSSLSSHLFHLSPHLSFWLSSFRSSLPVFLPSDVPLPPHLTSTSDALSHFSQLLSLFSSSLDELNSILRLHRAQSSFSSQIQSLDGTLRDFARKLREAEKVLDLLLDDYSNYRDEDGSNRNLLSVDEILSYAHRISYTTFAPPEFGAGTGPLRGALPPAPQDEQMRASQLYLVADLDVGVKKEAGERKDERMVENLIQPTPPREEVVPPEVGAFPPISVPAGWKKGMPIDLPADLPPVPPGWKPGDPIPLPPLDAGSMVEDQRVVAPVAPVGRQAEPIQVKYVQLDINPEDDYSSEYSSDVGSSDEDDEE